MMIHYYFADFDNILINIYLSLISILYKLTPMKMYSKEARGFNFKTESNSPTLSQQKVKGIPYDFNKITVYEDS